MNRWRIAVVMTLVVSILPSSASASSRYTFPVQGCSTTFSRYHHNYPATDILAKVGCAFVAPTSGVIDEVNRIDHFSWSTNKGADRGGKMISLIGDDGVRYYGSHLYSVRDVIQPGLRVTAGYLLGRVGQTGDTLFNTGTDKERTSNIIGMVSPAI